MSSLKALYFFVRSLILLPHAIIFFASKNKNLFLDVHRWVEVLEGRSIVRHTHYIYYFLKYMVFMEEFRNLYYYRVHLGRYLSFICRPAPTLFIHSGDIGPGLFIQHGFATIIAAKAIGENCWISQQVTIGYSKGTGAPVIGNNVHINAGAKIIGGVTVGDNSTIGANAVVVKSVPADCTVVGVPAYIVRRNGKKVRETL